MNAFAHAMQEGLFYVGSVCDDCTMAHENGDTSGNAPDWNEQQYIDTLAKYDVTIGHPHFNGWYEECEHNGHACPDDADCDCASRYSDSKCDMCGTWNEGKHQDYIFIEKALVR